MIESENKQIDKVTDLAIFQSKPYLFITNLLF